MKRESKVYWSLGYVVIREKGEILINSGSFTKRDKLFNLSGRLIDTKPLFINKLDLNLILSGPRSLIIYKSIYMSKKNFYYFYRKYSKWDKENLRLLLAFISLGFIIPVSWVAHISNSVLLEEEGNIDSNIFIDNNVDSKENLNVELNNDKPDLGVDKKVGIIKVDNP